MSKDSHWSACPWAWCCRFSYPRRMHLNVLRCKCFVCGGRNVFRYFSPSTACRPPPPQHALYCFKTKAPPSPFFRLQQSPLCNTILCGFVADFRCCLEARSFGIMQCLHNTDETSKVLHIAFRHLDETSAMLHKRLSYSPTLLWTNILVGNHHVLFIISILMTL